MRILFYDVATPYLYTAATVNQTAIGGTEATIARVAHGLSAFHDVFVAEHCREKVDECEEEGVHYISFATAQQLANFDVVILLRDHRRLAEVASHFTIAKMYLWMHNTPPRDFIKTKSLFLKYNCDVIAVSYYHRDLIEKRFKGKWFHRFINYLSPKSDVKVHVVYNPIGDDVVPDKTPFQSNKLLFLSSPQKGLVETLALFQKVLEVYPEYHLYVGNPGHRYLDIALPKQVELLGALPHRQVVQHLREAFCVFYPQHSKAETFGLVYAEANAVGTPVLAHRFGAAPEVLSDACQLVDGRDADQIIAKLAEWRKRRPVLQRKEEFRLRNVIQSWQNLLNK